MDEKKSENKCLKQLIITINIESINSVKAVCPICVKSHQLSEKKTRHVGDTRMRRNSEKGLFGITIISKRNFASPYNYFPIEMTQNALPLNG